MASSSRIEKHRKAEADRRRVRQQQIHRIGTHQRTRNPPPSRRTVRSTATAGTATMLITSIMTLLGTFAATTTALVGAAGTVGVAWLEYRRDLIEVKRTGKPIKDPQAKPKPTEPKPEAGIGSTPAEPQGPLEARWLAQQRQEHDRPKPQGKAVRRHADGSICTAKSDKTCRKHGATKRKPQSRRAT